MGTLFSPEWSLSLLNSINAINAVILHSITVRGHCSMSARSDKCMDCRLCFSPTSVTEIEVPAKKNGTFVER
ncbi:uncharacterized protein LACBIDRAFT_315569 [Laccaria bicolor S238N-H82]|uniref:Predicted protein n=1 Tax=Laccaria bicolor (strain S238N-H82 / ATCC MYA-4686) TaxID=486041 RepID=B0D2N4_LACBS|nr:uncharacterized protein LACBIDRAFT_315569 [Laccaria bicolor S238N-H82]EDR11126.1 predicted protein [Laccaria bicolor S238N-H82]|eukprot:XP_001878427.1 predicted protein [Laccaria bicolor S238N-H82]